MGKRDTSPEEILEYWKGYYTGEVQAPSDFAHFVKPLMLGSVVDIGCGDGRDTGLLNAVGIDPATVGGDVNHLPAADNYYARFFFHAVPEEIEDIVLEQIHGRLYAEMRIIGDDSFIEDHYRRLIDPTVFIQKLWKLGYTLDYFQKGYGLARYRDQNPLVARIVASR